MTAPGPGRDVWGEINDDGHGTRHGSQKFQASTIGRLRSQTKRSTNQQVFFAMCMRHTLPTAQRLGSTILIIPSPVPCLHTGITLHMGANALGPGTASVDAALRPHVVFVELGSGCGLQRKAQRYRLVSTDHLACDLYGARLSTRSGQEEPVEAYGTLVWFLEHELG